jgi:NTE family protein
MNQTIYSPFTPMTKKLLLLILSLSLLSSCCSRFQCYDNELMNLDTELPCYLPPEKPIRLALVLGGGGARGMAHVGVLEEFEKENIPIDLIIGCSAGSIVGALYSYLPDTRYVKSVLEPLKKEDLLDINLWFARYGLGQGALLKHFLLKQLGSTEFSDLSIPLVIVATDIATGELVSFGHGPVAPAVHASSAYPFYFTPVKLYGRVFVDGGVVNPVPVIVAEEHHADLIIAVDLCEQLPDRFPSNLFGVAKRCTEILFIGTSRNCVKNADIIIKPDTCGIGMFEDKFKEELYLAGKAAAKEAMPRILAAIKELDRQEEEYKIRSQQADFE